MAEVTLIEKVTKAITEPWWDSFDPERAAKNVIKAVLLDQLAFVTPIDYLDAEFVSGLKAYARHNGIDLNDMDLS